MRQLAVQPLHGLPENRRRKNYRNEKQTLFSGKKIDRTADVHIETSRDNTASVYIESGEEFRRNALAGKSCCGRICVKRRLSPETKTERL